MDLNIKKLEVLNDSRGWLTEILRPEDVGEAKFGQILITVAKPGQTKGGHFHKRKREWYLVIQGTARLNLNDAVTNEKKEIILDSAEPTLVEMPKNVMHSITNIGKHDMMLLVYISEPFNKIDPDTYVE
jgi:dTDP-4-dehydrorhamnose 3,5-epimerase-like enzyme